MGSNDGSERRDSTRKTRKKEERNTERDIDTQRHFKRHKRGGSLENPGPPCTRRAKSSVDSPRHCDDNDAGSPSLPLSHGSIHTATITGAGGKRVGDSPARGNERCDSVTSGQQRL